MHVFFVTRKAYPLDHSIGVWNDQELGNHGFPCSCAYSVHHSTIVLSKGRLPAGALVVGSVASSKIEAKKSRKLRNPWFIRLSFALSELGIGKKEKIERRIEKQ